MRRAFSLVELLIAMLVLAVFGAVCWELMRGGLRGLSAATDHQVALRNALLMTTALDLDFRAAAVLAERREYQDPYPIAPQTMVFSPARTSFRLRVSVSPDAIDADPASRFAVVTYQLVQHPSKSGLYQMRRDVGKDRHLFEDATFSEARYRFVASLDALSWRQFVMARLTAVEGAGPDGKPRFHALAREFEVPVPLPPYGSAGGPRGFAADFPPSVLGAQLDGAQDVVGRPGNLDPLEAPADALDRQGQPVTLPPEAPPGTVRDPFVREEPATTPLRGLFLQAALDHLVAAVGAGYRGALCGSMTGMDFRIDASETCPKPVMEQINDIFERAKAKGPASLVELLHRMQMDAFPGIDKPPLEAARMLLSERTK